MPEFRCSFRQMLSWTVEKLHQLRVTHELIRLPMHHNARCHQGCLIVIMLAKQHVSASLSLQMTSSMSGVIETDHLLIDLARDAIGRF